MMPDLLGAITMSRIVTDARLSGHILDVAERRLANQPAKPQKRTQPGVKAGRQTTVQA